jgi:hypothetical protein
VPCGTLYIATQCYIYAKGVCDIFRKRNVICLLRKRCGKSIECHPERNAVKPKDPIGRVCAVILEHSEGVRHILFYLVISSGTCESSEAEKSLPQATVGKR